MNLTDLQVGLREIENRISTLQTEIERMKPQTEEENKAKLEKIKGLAEKFPLKSGSLGEEDIELKKEYITCLAYITLAEEIKIHEKLLYLCRRAYGMDIFLHPEEILKMGMEVDEKYFVKACEGLKKLKYSFITDALILANITEEATDVTFSIMADMAKIMECDKEELRVMAYVAKAVLTNDMNVLQQLSVPNKNCWMGQFRQYIPLSWIESQRIECGKYCTVIFKKSDVILNQTYPYRTVIGEKPINAVKASTIKRRVQAGSIVKQGDELVAYEEYSLLESINETLDRAVSSAAQILCRGYTSTVTEKQSLSKEKKIYAPCDGVVFLIESEEIDSTNDEKRKYVYVYIVSYFDDYAEFCEWHKRKK